MTIPLNVGQTADVMVDIPVAARAGMRYALADQSRQPGTQAADAAMTFLTVWGLPNDPSKPIGTVDITTGPGSPNGPTGSDVTGVGVLRFTYTIPTFTPAVTAVRWSVDAPGVTPTVVSGPFAPAPLYNGSVPPARMATLVNGGHVLWMQWTNDPAKLAWGSPMGVPFTVDRQGPAMAPVDVDPVYSNGAVDVNIASTADATLTGTGVVTEALWSLTAAGNACEFSSGLPMTLNGSGTNGEGPVVAVTATIPAAAVPDTEGTYTVYAQAGDNRGMWSNAGDGSTSACGEGSIVIDRTEPTVTGADVSPNDNDGTMAFPTLDSYLPVVRITATVDDAGSGVASVEGFIDDGQPVTLESGTGFLFTPVDGEFDSATEHVYADIPLASVATLKPGPHKIWIHGQDLAGNWGTLMVPDPADTDPTDGTAQIPGPESTILRTVNTLPQVNDVYLTTNQTDANKTDVTITGAANGAGVTIQGYEYTVDGSAPFTVNIDPLDQHPVLNVTVEGLTITSEQNIAVRIFDSISQPSAVQFGKAVVAPPTLVKTPNGANPNRQRLSGLVVPSAGGAVDRVEWTIGAAPAAPGTGTSVTVTNNSYNTQRNAGFGPTGTVVWVRAHDPSGVWGPAVSVTVPA